MSEYPVVSTYIQVQNWKTLSVPRASSQHHFRKTLAMCQNIYICIYKINSTQRGRITNLWKCRKTPHLSMLTKILLDAALCPDPCQNVMGSILAHVQSFHQVSWKSVERFLRYCADKQTNQTNLKGLKFDNNRIQLNQIPSTAYSVVLVYRTCFVHMFCNGWAEGRYKLPEGDFSQLANTNLARTNGSLAICKESLNNY